MSSSALVPFAQHVRLRGRGPFQLPRMKGVLSIGDKSWPWPLLRFESEQGEEVWVPLAAEAVQSLNLTSKPGSGWPKIRSASEGSFLATTCTAKSSCATITSDQIRYVPMPLCYNISCLIQNIYELGIDPTFFGGQNVT